MTIYIDSDYKCHAEVGEGLIAVETDYFDGKCKELIEGYRLVPEGAVWTLEDGECFAGEMISPWKPYNELEAIQAAVERQSREADETIAELDEAYSNLLYEYILLEYGL